jgi:hypothetical protein
MGTDHEMYEMARQAHAHKVLICSGGVEGTEAAQSSAQQHGRIPIIYSMGILSGLGITSLRR